MDDRALREQLCQIGRLLHERGLVDGSSGNLSARLGAGRFLVTPGGVAKGFMQPEHLLIVDADGQRIDTPTSLNRDLRPTSELPMHLECYRQRPDVGGVVHAHPPVSVALTLVGYDFQRCVIPEMVVFLGLVPTTPYATPSSAENRDAIQQLVRMHDAILLAHHGSLTVGASVWDAYLKLESLEHGARILHLAEQVGGARTLPAEQVRKLLTQRRQLGLWREGDDERFAAYCGE